MTNNEDGFPLMASLPSGELARLRHRVAFLEAAMVQVMREDQQLREWYSAGELAALHLPGLPATASGIARLAKRERWESRIVTARGGERQQFHFSALPRAAFAAFIGIVLRGLGQPDAYDATPDALPPGMTGLSGAARRAPAADNATPQWVLPLVRLLRGGAPSLEDALTKLPKVAPPGMACPSAAEARATLRALGMLAS